MDEFALVCLAVLTDIGRFAVQKNHFENCQFFSRKYDSFEIANSSAMRVVLFVVSEASNIAVNPAVQ
ncbi:hypothetical protein KBI23_00195 [bacterium]|nr:hypothetical protein [bacterium]MBP9809144.1 hypothetical protein [bacterium]